MVLRWYTIHKIRNVGVTHVFKAIFFTLCCVATVSLAQSSGFGSIKANQDAPISLEADQLSVDEASNTALFEGAVEIAQGDMSLSAARVTVYYGDTQTDISKMIASGNVVLNSAPDFAKANQADFDIEAGTLILTGDVTVRQDGNNLTAQRIEIDLDTGAAKMSGRVKTILTPKK